MFRYDDDSRPAKVVVYDSGKEPVDGTGEFVADGTTITVMFTMGEAAEVAYLEIGGIFGFSFLPPRVVGVGDVLTVTMECSTSWTKL